MTLFKSLLPILAAAALGCTADPLHHSEFTPTPERTVYHAAKHVEASDTQRRAILAAWDANALEMRRLQTEAEALHEQWQALDRRSADFTARSDQLAARWGELGTAELKLRGRFEQDVAAALDPAQWARWQEFMREQERYQQAMAAPRLRRGM